MGSTAAGADAQIVVDFPSRLADGLARGAAGRGHRALDRALAAARPLSIVSDACTACDGPVRSVKLFSRVPLGGIRSLALDEGSRTSVALACILLKERFGLAPQLVSLPLGMRLADAATDAAVMIGDRAMREPDADFPCVCDLGQAWKDWTGLPLVFALWIARPGLDAAGIGRILRRPATKGAGHLEAIARRAAPEIGLPEADCLSYLRDHLQFHLGPRQRQGLARFFELAVRHGLAPEGIRS